MKVKEVVKVIESKYPLYLKEKWDNIGLIIGDQDADVTKILVTLDCTSKTIDEAISLGCNMIVSHHPYIFDSLKSITSKNAIGRKTLKAIENKYNKKVLYVNNSQRELNSFKHPVNTLLYNVDDSKLSFFVTISLLKHDGLYGTFPK